jgi:hypothetical protein
MDWGAEPTARCHYYSASNAPAVGLEDAVDEKAQSDGYIRHGFWVGHLESVAFISTNGVTVSAFLLLFVPLRPPERPRW